MMEWIVTSSVLILIVLLLRTVLKGKISLRLQYALWGLVLIRLLLPFSLFDSKFSVMNAVEHTVPGISEAGDRGVGQVVDGVPYFFDSERQPDFKVAVEEQPEEQVEEKLAPWQQEEAEIRVEVIGTPFSARDVIKVIWLGVGALIALWFLAVNLWFKRKLKRERSAVCVPHYPLSVYQSSVVETPCLFGLVRPAVYLTDEVTEETMEHVLAHELTHSRHGDHIWSALRCLCLVIHWYNPLVWLAASLSRRDAELACDEGTLKRIGEEQRTAYGRTLIDLTCRRRSNLALTATTMTGSKRGIKERVLLIAKKPRMKKWVLAVVLVLVIAAAGCTFSGAGETKTPGSDDDGYVWIITLLQPEESDEMAFSEMELQTPSGELCIQNRNLFPVLMGLYDGDEVILEDTIYPGGQCIFKQAYADVAYRLAVRAEVEPGTEIHLKVYDGNAEQEPYSLDPQPTEPMGTGEAIPLDRSGVTAPDAVIGCAVEYVRQQIDDYNEMGSNPPEGCGSYTITAAKLTGLEQINTGTAGLNDGVALYRLEYRLLADHPENIVMAGGMSVESGWLTERSSTGQPYLLFHYEDSGSETVWTPICVTNTDVIEVDYGTPEMLEKYGNAYTAAAMELYGKYQGQQPENGGEIIYSWDDWSEEDIARWQRETDGYGLVIQTDTADDLEVGRVFAEALAARFVNASEDHPARCTDAVVLNSILDYESLAGNPKRLIFSIEIAYKPVNEQTFVHWNRGWVETLGDDWYCDGFYYTLEQTSDGSWECIDVGTGGYGGWGYLNYEFEGVFDIYFQEFLNEEETMEENMLATLFSVDWENFDTRWGAEGRGGLKTLLDTVCLTEGRVYGPEGTRMWSDVYPQDQLYRNLYVMHGAWKAGTDFGDIFGEALKKQQACHPAIFGEALLQLPSEMRTFVENLMN